MTTPDGGSQSEARKRVHCHSVGRLQICAGPGWRERRPGPPCHVGKTRHAAAFRAW